jgi:hypothetical protein
MEYLMTYGWAILIIAVVLAALFALGVFNGSNLSGNACIASPGFLCSGAIYSHSTANIIVAIGQSTGTSWTSANFVFVPQGTPLANGLPVISFNSSPANTELATSGLASGGSATIYLPVNSIVPPVTVGTAIVGTIWAKYSYIVSSGGISTIEGPQYVQIASVNLKAS